jgi:uncharacterized membrane protein YcaP (DUF421 family)
MKKEEIHLGDWQRLLMGNAPVEFLLETLVRTLLMYAILLVILRLLGKRMNGQLTITELAVMISLGAIVSLPMQVPERGLLPALVLLLLIVGLQRGINSWAFRNPKIERLVQGRMSVLVKDGVIQLSEIERNSVSQDQLFAQLRSKNVENLGQVERVYLEACGLFSIFVRNEPRPGLSVFPERDQELLQVQQPADHLQACRPCGNVVKGEEECPNCYQKEWAEAII